MPNPLDDADRDCITRILGDLDTTDRGTDVARLLPALYDELRSLSRAYLARERADHTLQATALVNEAYLRLADGDGVAFTDRAHFFRVAAKTMRCILVDHARGRNALKRGAGGRGAPLDATELVVEDEGIDLLELEDALSKLEGIDASAARVVELRAFAGLSIAQTASATDSSTATVERQWRFAKAWLRSELGDS